jgi:hypothetical protein
MTKYLLKIRDQSGRDYSNVLSFVKEENREKEAAEMLKADGADGEYLADLLRQLAQGQVIVEEATEYEYMIQYEDADHDS